LLTIGRAEPQPDAGQLAIPEQPRLTGRFGWRKRSKERIDRRDGARAARDRIRETRLLI